MSELTTDQRNNLGEGAFALPGRRYPIHDAEPRVIISMTYGGGRCLATTQWSRHGGSRIPTRSQSKRVGTESATRTKSGLLAIDTGSRTRNEFEISIGRRSVAAARPTLREHNAGNSSSKPGRKRRVWLLPGARVQPLVSCAESPVRSCSTTATQAGRFVGGCAIGVIGCSGRSETAPCC